MQKLSRYTQIFLRLSSYIKGLKLLDCFSGRRTSLYDQIEKAVCKFK